MNRLHNIYKDIWSYTYYVVNTPGAAQRVKLCGFLMPLTNLDAPFDAASYMTQVDAMPEKPFYEALLQSRDQRVSRQNTARQGPRLNANTKIKDAFSQFIIPYYSQNHGGLYGAACVAMVKPGTQPKLVEGRWTENKSPLMGEKQRICDIVAAITPSAMGENGPHILAKIIAETSQKGPFAWFKKLKKKRVDEHQWKFYGVQTVYQAIYYFFVTKTGGGNDNETQFDLDDI
jgi:hypothetical protein